MSSVVISLLLTLRSSVRSRAWLHRDPRPPTSVPCSRAVTPSAGTSDASRPRALGVVVTCGVTGGPSSSC